MRVQRKHPTDWLLGGSLITLCSGVACVGITRVVNCFPLSAITETSNNPFYR